MTDLDVKGLVERLLDGVRACGLHDDNETELFDIEGGNELMAEAATALLSLSEKVEGMEKALHKIDSIRDSIIGFQNVGWSDHIYPLVAALKDAGFSGKGYDAMRTELRTMIAAETRAEAAEQRVQKLEGLVEQAFRDGLAYGSNVDIAVPDIAWGHSRVRQILKEQP